jgi:Na+/melibiose symporter-like transporter
VPESRDPDAAPRLDLAGTTLAALGLGGLTYALTAAGDSGVSPTVVVLGALGVAGLAVFVMVERSSRHPLVPTALFRNAQFSAANAVTLFVYAALGVLFVLLVLHLQVVAGFSPLLAGSALLPLTVIMLVFSARVGALAQQIGPRILLTMGPLVSAAGVWLLLRINLDASYALDVLPAVTVFGAGLALTVAPLTATVLDSAADRYAGVASGVNNAVARAAGLLAVAVVPVVAGIGGDDYTDPVTFGASFRTALLIIAGLLVAGALVAFGLIRRPLDAAETAQGEPVDGAAARRFRLEECAHCGVTGPQVYPRHSEDSPLPGP